MKTKILMMTPLMLMSPSSAKPVLILSFDFGLIGSELLLVEIGKSISPHFA
jgi:hypothetical protein